MRVAVLLVLVVLVTNGVADNIMIPAGPDWMAHVNETLARQQQWVRGAEDIMAHIVLGPLQEQLKGAAFSQRNRTQIVQVQTNHLRAHVMQRLLQALEEDVEICPWPRHVSQQAVQNIVTELKKHEFIADWVPNLYRCPGQTGFIRVHVPLPAFE